MMMLKVSPAFPVRSSISPPKDALQPPRWAREFPARAATLVSQSVTGVRALDAESFRAKTIEAYHRLHAKLAQSPHPNIVRIWNHIPGIHHPMDGGVDRYMVFNAARHHVMSGWFGGESGIAMSAPAASGVGHDGDELVLHALAVAQPGAAIENPLQVPAYRYSKRYGPLPPCFARATRITTPTDALLIAGTAAITGEQSQHVDDLCGQFELTLQNLKMLIRVAANKDDALPRMQHVRIYHAARADREHVRQLAANAFSGEMQFITADLCRAELLVEIEGIARLDKAK